MIRQLRVAAGVDLKLSHSCLAEPYRASVDVFPPEWDRLPVLPGSKRRWLRPSDTRSLMVEFGEWRCLLAGLEPGGQVSSLSCVYLLASCGENLPINCMLILPVYDSTVLVVLLGRRMIKLAFLLITATSFPFGSSHLLFFFGHICCHALSTLNSFMHAHNHIWASLACGGAKQSPSNENPPSSSWNPSSVSHQGRSLSSAAPSMQLIRTVGPPRQTAGG